MPTRVASARLIGRSGERAELEVALRDAAAGTASVALVAGESGVGKTRLLNELAQSARDDGVLVLIGETVDFGGEGELPYLPLVAALRPLARSGEVNEAVAPLFSGGDREAPAAADEGAQARLFEGLLSLLDELGREQPVLLVIEDLHWADPSTRAALAFLGRNLTSERVLLVASYRPEELDRGHPLRGLLAAGLDGRGALPDTLRDALMLRIERLSGAARALLPIVAIAHRIDDRLLEATSDLERRALREGLREAVDGHVLVVEDDGTYRFRHALLREVVDSDLLPGERARIHLALARALEEDVDTGDAQLAGAVAHHFAASGDTGSALAAAVRAGDAAARVHAYGEAASLLARALELWDRVPDAEARTGTDRVELLLRAADAAGALAHSERQLDRLREAFAALGDPPDRERAARVLEATARAQRHLNHARDGIATLERALELAPVGPERARVLATLARAEMLVGRYRAAIPSAREALATTTDPLVEANARNTLGFSRGITGEPEEGAADLREAIRIARERDSAADLGEGYDNLASLLLLVGRTREALAVAREGRREIGERRPASAQWLDVGIAEIAFEAGDWELAERSVPSPLRWTGGQKRMGITMRRLALALGRGDHVAAAALVEELEPMGAQASEPHLLSSLGVMVAELRRREGDARAALATVDEWLERVAAGHDDVVAVSALGGQGVSAAADAAQRARDVGDIEAEAAALARVDELLARIAADDSRPVECAVLLSARAEATRAAGRPDAAAYERAAAAWDAVERPEPAVRMRWRAAEAHVAAGDRDAAGAAARAAHEAAVALGAGWLRGEVESLAARARLGLDEERMPAETAPEPDAFGLTERERQVLALLSGGATNREIGATLFMAEKTASVHVSRILAKLGVRSRTEAAAVAYRHGLGPRV